MSWNPNFPLGSTLISASPPQLRTNWTDLQNTIGTDHQYMGQANQGAHNKATLLQQVADPAAVAGRGFIYSKAVSGITELFYEDSTGKVSQITANGSAAYIRAYVRFDGTGAEGASMAIASSFNVTSVVRGAAPPGNRDYTINFTIPLPTNTYSFYFGTQPLASNSNPVFRVVPGAGNITTSLLNISSYDYPLTSDLCPSVCVTIIGG